LEIWSLGITNLVGKHLSEEEWLANRKGNG
jgi:hypothetical protein